MCDPRFRFKAETNMTGMGRFKGQPLPRTIEAKINWDEVKEVVTAYGFKWEEGKATVTRHSSDFVSVYYENVGVHFGVNGITGFEQN